MICPVCGLENPPSAMRCDCGHRFESGEHVFPEPANKFQTFWPRSWAGLIDGLIFLPLSLVDPWIYSNINQTGVLAIWFIISSVSFLAYSVLCHGIWGQTIGKRFTGVRVLDLAESKLSMRQAVLRDSLSIPFVVVSLIAYFPSAIQGHQPYTDVPMGIVDLVTMYAAVGLFLVELVTMLANPKRRALHDFIAGSVVVRVSQRRRGTLAAQPATGADRL